MLGPPLWCSQNMKVMKGRRERRTELISLEQLGSHEKTGRVFQSPQTRPFQGTAAHVSWICLISLDA